MTKKQAAFTLSRGETLRRYSGAAGGGDFTLEVSVYNGRIRRHGRAGVHRREQKGDKTPNGFLSPS